MVVHSISATATPPRPSSVSLAFRMKRNGGGGLSARRALSALGNNNAQINLRLAESLLTITQDKFMKKWNFDPLKEAPMAPGRFQWAPVGSGVGANPDVSYAAPHETSSITANRDISTCFTLPCQDISSRVPEPHSTTTTTTTENTKVVTVEADSGVESDDSVIEDPDTTITAEETTSAATRQTIITDYLNPRKRSSSHLDCPDSLQLPASKKMLLLAN